MRDIDSAEARAFDEAQRAQAILEDPWFNQVLTDLEDELFEEIQNSLATDTDVREGAYHRLQAMKRLRAKLKGYSDNWELAKAKKVRLI